MVSVRVYELLVDATESGVNVSNVFLTSLGSILTAAYVFPVTKRGERVGAVALGLLGALGLILVAEAVLGGRASRVGVVAFTVLVSTVVGFVRHRTRPTRGDQGPHG